MTQLLHECLVLSKTHPLMKFREYTMLSSREMDFNAKRNHITDGRTDKGNTIRTIICLVPEKLTLTQNLTEVAQA